MNARLTSKSFRMWIPVAFSAVLSGIALFANVQSHGGSAGMIPFLSFFPMCFFFAANALRDTRSEIEALETRIKQLESEKVA